MKLHSILLLFVLIVIALFTALNWNVFLSPTELSLGYTTVHMPLGLVMLGLLVFVTVLFLAFVAYLQGSALLETRRHSRELLASKELADRAEASRFTELHTYIETELAKQITLSNESKAELLARIDQLENDFRSFSEKSENTIVAYIGELEDRLGKNAISSSVP